MNHVMLDLETMSTQNNAAITSIGACFFEPTTGEIGTTFYMPVNLESAAHFGVIDAKTVLWWLKQSDCARHELTKENRAPLHFALESFKRFIADSTGKVEIWGNGIGFDNVILANAFNACGIKLPWHFSNDRDVRTIVALGKALLGYDPKNEMAFSGTAHNALDDAIHQAKYVSAIYKKLATPFSTSTTEAA